ARIRKKPEDLLGGRLKGRHRVRIRHQRSLRRRRSGESDPAIDLPARELRRDGLAHGGLERPEFLRNARLELQVAVVDGLQLDREPARGGFLGRAGEAGHAGDHWAIESKWPRIISEAPRIPCPNRRTSRYRQAMC